MDISTYVSQHYFPLLTLLQTLCKIPAPTGTEQARAVFCKAWLEEHGAKGVVIDSAKNVVFPINCEGSNNITVFAAHTDTVFPDLAPLPYSEDEEKIYCPGVGDNTAHMAVLLLVAKYFIQHQLSPKDGVLFVFNAGEEGLGNLNGTRTLFSDYAGRIGRFVSLDAKLGVMNTRTVGSHRFEVTLNTRGGHSFMDFGEKNAIAELSKIVEKIYAIEVPKKGDSNTTYNVGTITGGTSVNPIAQRATMTCEYRSDNIECLAMMEEKFAEIFFAAELENDITVQRIGERPCSVEDETGMDELKTLCQAITEEVTGEAVTFKSSSTDCNIPRSLGIPAICIGACRFEGAHTREEWLEKASLSQGLTVALKTALRLVGEEA